MGRGRSARSYELIDAASRILSEIQPASVRAVCYRLFTEGLLANMSKDETNKVSKQLTWAREQGEIPWEWIVDETRHMEQVATWDDADQFVKSTIKQYRRDRWTQQPVRVEVWSEKGTVRGTLAPVLDAYGVGFRVQHGYGSATSIHQAAEDAAYADVPVIALYLGDWDPSGLHMSEVDLPERLDRYHEGDGDPIELRRVALNDEDIIGDTLPDFPLETKAKDGRYSWFKAQMASWPARYHGRCWELDALSPVVLRDRVKAAIESYIEPEVWARCERAEAAERESLKSVLTNWQSISRPASKYSDDDVDDVDDVVATPEPPAAPEPPTTGPTTEQRRALRELSLFRR